jgi:uncharacterized membrane protein
MATEQTPPPTINSNNEPLLGLLSYILAPIVGIIILLTDMKNSPTLNNHAVQSIALSVVLFILAMVLSIATFGILSCLVPILWIIVVVIYGIQAYQGKTANIPLVTDFCRNQKWI